MKNKPKCVFLERGGHACDISLPKPNQLCSQCRPHWAAKRGKNIAPVKR
jgi:hypothetical protein